MLVNGRPGQIRPIENIAGIAHGQGERHGFIAFHAIEKYGHGESGNLSLGDRP
jgi:hypothetical protein